MATLASVPETTLDLASRNAAAQDKSVFTWYTLATLTTSLSSFALLADVRRVVATGDAPMLQPLASLLWSGGVAAPLLAGRKGVVLAGVLWSVTVLQNATISLRHCLYAVFVAELVLVVPNALQAVVAFFRGASKSADLALPLGARPNPAPAVMRRDEPKQPVKHLNLGS